MNKHREEKTQNVCVVSVQLSERESEQQKSDSEYGAEEKVSSFYVVDLAVIKPAMLHINISTEHNINMQKVQDLGKC